VGKGQGPPWLVTDDLWVPVEPLLPVRPRHRPRPLFADRGYDYDKYRHLLWQRGPTRPSIASAPLMPPRPPARLLLRRREGFDPSLLKIPAASGCQPGPSGYDGDRIARHRRISFIR
jgi:hypothetical protein